MLYATNLRPHSLRARVLTVFIAGMALSAGLVTVGILVLAKPFGERMLRESVEKSTEGLSRYVLFDAEGKPVGLDETKVGRWLLTTFRGEIQFRILDDRGQVVYALDPKSQALAPDEGHFDPERRAFALTLGGVAMHASTAPLMRDGRRWYVQFASSDRLAIRMRESFSLPALWQGIAAICLTFFVIFLVTIHATLRRALEPLLVASNSARQITPRNLDARLNAEAQPIELRPLVEAFNQALDRLQQGFRTQQEFLSSAAHELKTPLSLMRAQVERFAADERTRLLLQDVDHMARQVQQLLLLAEVSEPQNFRIESIDPHSSIQEVFDYMTRVAEKRAVYLGLRIGPSVRQWQVDRGALFTLLKNLMENAIQHSPQGSIVTLSASATGLSVLDQGPGIPAEHLPLMFDRFWKGAARREEGAGLGLAICREIALAHGWNLQARNHERGLEVFVEMPVPFMRPVHAEGSAS